MDTWKSVFFWSMTDYTLCIEKSIREHSVHIFHKIFVERYQDPYVIHMYRLFVRNIYGVILFLSTFMKVWRIMQ